MGAGQMLEKLLNVVSMLGWGVILSQLFPFSGPLNYQKLHNPVLALEGLCIVEVVRMLVGNLQGNWMLGVVLHATR